MNDIKFHKELEIAIKAAKSAGNFLNEDKNSVETKITTDATTMEGPEGVSKYKEI